MVDRETLEYMMSLWAGFQRREFREVDWPTTSMTGKIIEAHKLGIFSHGTSSENNEGFDYRESIHTHIQLSLNELSKIHKSIILLEYLDTRSRKKKFNLIDVRNLTAYRARLCRARKKLMQII